MFIYATPTFLTEAFHLITQVQLQLQMLQLMNALYGISIHLLGCFP